MAYRDCCRHQANGSVGRMLVLNLLFFGRFVLYYILVQHAVASADGDCRQWQ
jgi:hypothetical protein